MEKGENQNKKKNQKNQKKPKKIKIENKRKHIT